MDTGRYKQAMSFIVKPKYIKSDFVIPKMPVPIEELPEPEANLAEEIQKILSTAEK